MSDPYFCPYCDQWFPSDDHVPCPTDRSDTQTDARVIKHNTGRLYTRDGQPITITVTGKRARFVDHARMIVGIVDLFHEAMSDETIIKHVMREYDHNRYEMDA